MDTFNPNQMPPISSLPKEKSVWPIALVVIVLVAVIVGGLYILNSKSSYEAPTPVPPTTEKTTDSLDQQNPSDDLNSIEQDLSSTNFDTLDQGASSLEAELQ